MLPPSLPFHGFKWRWASVEPTEGLNEPSVFLGVLRAFRDCSGLAPSDKRVATRLLQVQTETHSSVDLVRTPSRNLVRNSGQYWKATGLLLPSHGRITITPFGQMVADGKITRSEFAATVIRSLTLPNTHIYSKAELTAWNSARLHIKPLELIIQVLKCLGQDFDISESYITPDELIRIVIPLSGSSATAALSAKAIISYRRNGMDVSAWPDCAPRSNDKRMAAEYLIFLNHYGYCRKTVAPGSTRWTARYYLEDVAVSALLDVRISPAEGEVEIASDLRASGCPAEVARRRRTTTVLSRPQQAQFRRRVLAASHSTCLITRSNIPEALEAAHIIPVESRGTDTVGNGLCLRSDIHDLFDSGHIRINSRGELHYSDPLKCCQGYPPLPNAIALPKYIALPAVEWRWNYC